MTDLTPAEKLRLVHALDEAEHWQAMYRAAFGAAVDAHETIRKQQECIADLRETIRRCACEAFPAETRS